MSFRKILILVFFNYKKNKFIIIPPNTVFAGSPAKFISTYDEYLENCKLRSTSNIHKHLRKKTLIKMFKEILNS